MILKPAAAMALRKRCVLACRWSRSRVDAMSLSRALEAAATTGGGSALENRYGRDRWRRMVVTSLELLV